MRVTAYSSTPDQTDDTPFITANGTHVADGIIASNVLPFGTKVQIPELFGNKIFTVEDRMSKRIKNTIDIWMPTRIKALWFGVHESDIVLVTTATGHLTINEK
jgi:3D (Asp-Asp-Asp) domain-containing protein